MARHNVAVREAFDLAALSDLQVLVEILKLVVARPDGVPDEWLVTDLGAVHTATDSLEGDIDAVAHQEERRVRGLVGDEWLYPPRDDDTAHGPLGRRRESGPGSGGHSDGWTSPGAARSDVGVGCDGRPAARRVLAARELAGASARETFVDVERALTIASVPLL